MLKMIWKNEELKRLVAKKALTQDALAQAIGVSRQTVNAWMSGQVPNGKHLLKLWQVLGLKPGSLID